MALIKQLGSLVWLCTLYPMQKRNAHALFSVLRASSQDVAVETDKQGRPRVRYEKGGGFLYMYQGLACQSVMLNWRNTSRQAGLGPAYRLCRACGHSPTAAGSMHAGTHPCTCVMRMPKPRLPSLCPCRLELLGVAGPQGALHHRGDTGGSVTQCASLQQPDKAQTWRVHDSALRF